MVRTLVGTNEPVTLSGFLRGCINDLVKFYSETNANRQTSTEICNSLPLGTGAKKTGKKKKNGVSPNAPKTLCLARALAQKSMKTFIDLVDDPKEWLETLNKKGGNWVACLNILIPPDMDPDKAKEIRREWRKKKRKETPRILKGIKLARDNGLRWFISERLNDAEKYPELSHLFPEPKLSSDSMVI